MIIYFLNSLSLNYSILFIFMTKKTIIVKNNLICLNLFFFIFFNFFWIEPTFCESTDSFDEVNLSSNENQVDKDRYDNHIKR